MCVCVCVCVELQIHAFLTSTLMVVSGQLRDIVALLSGKELRLPIERLVGPQGMCGRNIISVIKLRERVGGLSVTDKIY